MAHLNDVGMFLTDQIIFSIDLKKSYPEIIPKAIQIFMWKSAFWPVEKDIYYCLSWLEGKRQETEATSFVELTWVWIHP